MTADAGADRPESGRQALVQALRVRRYARVAVALAAVFTVTVAGYFVVLLSGGQTEDPVGFYPALGFVVFVATAMLALVVLVGRRVLALAVHPASLVRWSATGGLVAGVLWLAAGGALFLGPAQPWASVVDVATPWAPLLTPFGLWAVYTRYKRSVVLPRIGAMATLAALAGALALADLAAVELVGMLPDVGRPVDPGTVGLYRGGAVLLVGGQSVVAVQAFLGDGNVTVPALLIVPSTVGLAGYLALGTGRTGIGTFAIGQAACWLLASWQLRQVADADVPAGPSTADRLADAIDFRS